MKNTMKNLLKDFWDKCVDLGHPRACAVCGDRLAIAERLLCGNCNFKLTRTYYWKNAKDNEMAKAFWVHIPVERAAAWFFHLPHTNESQLIYRLKYGEQPEIGEKMGFKTFVLQSGEDPYYTDELIVDIIKKIKAAHPDCAVTLSIGEKSHDSYQKYFDAGADRYLLRHETANEEHYSKLHPESMSGAERKNCLYDLKKIGFQVGCGIMVGTPCQTTDHIYEDIVFMKDLQPHMIGIGPFIAHKDTPFKDEPNGSVERTLRLLAVLRLIFPKVLLPATTALGTADAMGREKGILAGANVMMPNLSPVNVRKKYLLYDGKICTGEEAAECNACMRGRVERIGFHIADTRGDHPDFIR